ncbi:MAG TPA: hypothetical protein VM513_31295 [Kofleriaceae bacterium]|nr:hypothetical protein [Kofleriaceae bacterium]
MISLAEVDNVLGTSTLPPPQLPTTEASSVAQYRQFIRARLAEPLFVETLAKELLPFVVQRPIMPRALVQGKTRDGRAFYYRSIPCPSSQLTSVRPWWDLTTSVLICRDEYRPTVLYSSDHTTECTSPTSPTFGCGCGPFLLFCARDAKQKAVLDAAVYEEVLLTLKHVIDTRRPLSDLLTMNETVRSGYGDFYYARTEFLLHGDPAVLAIRLDAPPTLKPRPPQYGGGLLSMPGLLYADSARRVIMMLLWSDLLCLPFRSVNVEPHVLIDAARDKPALRSESHEELTVTPGCQNCHSRLEYGLRAFAGWSFGQIGTSYDPKRTVASTRFYGADHTDLRDEGPATPAWLGAEFVSQPEFAACMVHKVGELVFEGEPVPGALSRYLRAEFARTQDLATLVEDTLIARTFGLATLSRGTASN